MKVLSVFKRALGVRSAKDVEADVIAPYFDRVYYLDAYPDVRDQGVDPLRHFVSVGWKEGRDPCPWFSTRHYVDLHPDVDGHNPFLHYVRYGRGERRKIAPAQRSAVGEIVLPKSEPVNVFNDGGITAAVEVRARLGRRLGYISGWAMSGRGQRVRLAPSPSKGGTIECLSFVQDREDIGAARTDLGFRLLLNGNFEADSVSIELTEDSPEKQRSVTLGIELSEVPADHLASLQAETILKCQPADDSALPNAIRHLVALRTDLDSEVSGPALQRISQLVPDRPALKVLLIARNEPRVSYFNLVLLASRLRAPADFVLATLGTAARQYAAANIKGLSLPVEQSLTLIEGAQSVASGPLIKGMLKHAAEQHAPCLCVLDEVSVAPALEEICAAAALSECDRPEWDVQGWTMHTHWPEDPGSGRATPSVKIRSNYPRTPRPIGVLLTTKSASVGLSRASLPPYPGRGWALTNLFDMAPASRLGATSVIDLLSSYVDTESMCALLASHTVQSLDSESEAP